MKNYLEYFAWYGAIAVLFAYMLSSFSIISTNGLIYLLLNATGSAGIAIISIKKGAMQPAALNIVWLIVTLFALGNLN